MRAKPCSHVQDKKSQQPCFFFGGVRASCIVFSHCQTPQQSPLPSMQGIAWAPTSTQKTNEGKRKPPGQQVHKLLSMLLDPRHRKAGAFPRRRARQAPSRAGA